MLLTLIADDAQVYSDPLDSHAINDRHEVESIWP